jgi:hypothetical protein
MDDDQGTCFLAMPDKEQPSEAAWQLGLSRGEGSSGEKKKGRRFQFGAPPFWLSKAGAGRRQGVGRIPRGGERVLI